MGRPELGTKLVCVTCAERFYDLNRVPAICPKCSAQQPVQRPRASRPAVYGSLTRTFSSRPARAVVEPVAAEDELEPAGTSEAEDSEDTEDDTDTELDQEQGDESA